jgi:hypothetical protein
MGTDTNASEVPSMSFLRNNSKVVLVALCCLALGAGASAIASAGAATGGKASRHAAQQRLWTHRGLRARGLSRVGRHAVQGTVVLATRHGFKTVSFDRGTVVSVSGAQLTLSEGSAKTARRNVTLTVPSTARIRDDRRAASLSALKAGQRVMVIRAPRRTLVIAHAARPR